LELKAVEMRRALLLEHWVALAVIVCSGDVLAIHIVCEANVFCYALNMLWLIGWIERRLWDMGSSICKVELIVCFHAV
jgi:hypothetical protein